jgi:hypothetical protein
VRCAVHILNLVVNEGLKGLSDCVFNIRNAMNFVRSSLGVLRERSVSRESPGLSLSSTRILNETLLEHKS